MTLRSRQAGREAPPRKTGSEGEGQAEFQGFKLRKTAKGDEQPKTRGGHDFGIKLKPKDDRPTPATTDALPSRRQEEREEPRSRAKTYSGARENKGSAPRTMRDYQELTKRSRDRGRQEDEGEAGPPMATGDLHRHLVAYVNQTLSLHPPLPARGKALFDTCSNTTILCKLINKSVPNTVDLRALTVVSPSSRPSLRAEADQENMTLVIESARAIGCQITDSTADNILQKDPQTIRDFLVDLIRARVVHMPGMDEEPASTFVNLSSLFSKLNISLEDEEPDEGIAEKPGSSQDEDSGHVQEAPQSPEPTPETRSRRDKAASPTSQPDRPAMDSGMSYEERAALRKAERERRARERAAGGGAVSSQAELSYEERAAQRRAEREKRRRERELLANQ